MICKRENCDAGIGIFELIFNKKYCGRCFEQMKRKENVHK